MQIVLYSNLSETIVLNKNIEQTSTLKALLKEESNVSSPTLILTMTPGILFSNYAYIEKFRRYYYIIGSTVLDNNRIQLDCQVDVLMSFKSQILASKQNIVRQEKRYNMYMEDSNMQVLSKTEKQTLNFKEGFQFSNENIEGYSYVLNTL